MGGKLDACANMLRHASLAHSTRFLGRVRVEVRVSRGASETPSDVGAQTYISAAPDAIVCVEAVLRLGSAHTQGPGLVRRRPCDGGFDRGSVEGGPSRRPLDPAEGVNDPDDQERSGRARCGAASVSQTPKSRRSWAKFEQRLLRWRHGQPGRTLGRRREREPRSTACSHTLAARKVKAGLTTSVRHAACARSECSKTCVLELRTDALPQAG